MDCLFLEPFLYLYYQLPIVADRSGPIPTNVWPPPPSVDVLFSRQRAEFLSKRVFYPWGGQLPRYATEMGNVIYEKDCLPFWVPKPMINMYHALENLHKMAEQPPPPPSMTITHKPDTEYVTVNYDGGDEKLELRHVGARLAETLMREIEVLPDFSMSSDRQFNFFADDSRFCKVVEIKPFVRSWLGNGANPELSPWSPCHAGADNLLVDHIVDPLEDQPDFESPYTPTSPTLDMTDTHHTSSFTSTAADSTNLMTPRSEVDLFTETRQDDKASGPSFGDQHRDQEDSDGESDELIVVPRLWNLPIFDLTGATPHRSPSPSSPPPILVRSYEKGASSERVQSPVQSILHWRDNAVGSHYVGSSANVTRASSDGTIVPSVIELPLIENTAPSHERTTSIQDEAETPAAEIGREDSNGEDPRNEDYEVISPGSAMVHVDAPTSRWLYGILHEQDDDDDDDDFTSITPSTSTSSLGSELSSKCSFRLCPRAAPLGGPPPNLDLAEDNCHLSNEETHNLLGFSTSDLQRQPSRSMPSSSVHEEILTWITGTEDIAPCNDCRLPVSPSGGPRKPSRFARILNKVKRGPVAIQRMLRDARWLSVPLTLRLWKRKSRG